MAAFDDDEDIIRAKVVLLGNTGVGKTCLVIKYKTGNFPHMAAPTIGASYMAKTVQVNKSHKIKLQMWDTAGQERFQSMASMYYRGADAAVLVFDLTEKKSLYTVKHWVKELQQHTDVSEDIVLVLAANKADMVKDSNVQSKTLWKDSCEYASDIRATLFKTSASTGHGVNEMFGAVAAEVLKIKLEKGGGKNDRNHITHFDDDKTSSKCCELM